MTVREFSLAPFPGEEAPPIAITGSIGRDGDGLSLRFLVRGPLAELSLPAPEPSPARKDRLWEESCLELFLAATGSERYWEFHLSPSGHWNVYRFDAYREGMREEPAFAALPFRARREPDAFRISTDIGAGSILPAGSELAAGVAAVVRARAGATSHWALAHPGPRPDFHLREAFRLRLPPGR